MPSLGWTLDSPSGQGIQLGPAGGRYPGMGRSHHESVLHRRTSFPARVLTHHKHDGWRRRITAAADGNTGSRCRREKTSHPEELDRRPSALRDHHRKPVEDAAAKAIAERLSVYRRNFHAASSGLGGLSSFGSIYLSGDEFEAQEGNKKPLPPKRKKWPTLASDC